MSRKRACGGGESRNKSVFVWGVEKEGGVVCMS